jgi:hypothetical protein
MLLSIACRRHPLTPAVGLDQAPIPPPSYHRTVASALHLDALTLVSRLELLALCRLAVQLAQRQCSPPLRAGPGGAPRVYREDSLFLLALLRTLWRLSYREMHDWLVAWPALAVACGLPLGPDGRPRVPSPAQPSKRLRSACGVPLRSCHTSDGPPDANAASTSASCTCRSRSPRTPEPRQVRVLGRCLALSCPRPQEHIAPTSILPCFPRCETPSSLVYRDHRHPNLRARSTPPWSQAHRDWF